MAKTSTHPKGSTAAHLAYSGADAVHKVVNSSSVTITHRTGEVSRLVIPSGLETSKVVIDGKPTSIQSALAVKKD